MESVKFFI